MRATSPCASGRASDGEDEARATLLHLHRHRPDVERARLEAALDRVRDELGREVVEVRLEQDDPARRTCRLGAEDDADDVRPVGEGPSCPRRSRRPRASAAAARPTPRRSSRRSRRPSASRARPPCRRRRARLLRAARASRARAAGARRGRPSRSRGRTEAATRRRARRRARRAAANAPQTSTSVSSEPSSWKWTSSGATPWMPPSTSARRANASSDRARTALGKVGRLDERADVAVGAMRVIVGERRCGGASAPIPWRSTRSTLDLHALEAERDRNATERLELRARVEERREEHVAREPADAVEVRDAAQSRPRAIRAAIVPGAEAVVDPDDGEAGGARGEHRVQRRRPAVRRAVADARRHADHRAAREPADEARERAVHPRDHDDAVGPLEIGQRRAEPVDARDADVLVHDDGRPEQLGADLAPRARSGRRTCRRRPRRRGRGAPARRGRPRCSARARPPRPPGPPRGRPRAPRRRRASRARFRPRPRAARRRSPRPARASCPRRAPPRGRPGGARDGGRPGRSRGRGTGSSESRSSASSGLVVPARTPSSSSRRSSRSPATGR